MCSVSRVYHTSKCLVASSLRDISISLVRMLRKCMSLRIVARFTVVSFVDCERSKAVISLKNLYAIKRPGFRGLKSCSKACDVFCEY